MFESLMAWMSTVPPAVLLSCMWGLAAVENVFPPIPADVLVAFGGFVAARGHASPWPVFLAVWTGNVCGAAVMFLLGRRYGTAYVERRFKLAKGGAADARLLSMYQRYGLLAFFLSRFVPGVRSVVPPVAGALALPFTAVMIAIAAASGVWYGAITWLAFRAGTNWGQLQETLGRFGTVSAIVAAVLIVAGVARFALRSRTP